MPSQPERSVATTSLISASRIWGLRRSGRNHANGLVSRQRFTDGSSYRRNRAQFFGFRSHFFPLPSSTKFTTPYRSDNDVRSRPFGRCRDAHQKQNAGFPTFNPLQTLQIKSTSYRREQNSFSTTWIFIAIQHFMNYPRSVYNYIARLRFRPSVELLAELLDKISIARKEKKR